MTTKRTKAVRVTLEDVRSWGACYSIEKLEKLAGKRKSITALQILDLPILTDDKLWAVLREPFFSGKEMMLLAADFAERALPNFEREYPNDSRPRDAIAARRAFARGEIDDAARSAAREAASDAAWSAAWSAARSAAMAAACDAAWSAAREAAWSAASDAESNHQIEMVRAALIQKQGGAEPTRETQ